MRETLGDLPGRQAGHTITTKLKRAHRPGEAPSTNFAGGGDEDTGFGAALRLRYQTAAPMSARPPTPPTTPPMMALVDEVADVEDDDAEAVDAAVVTVADTPEKPLMALTDEVSCVCSELVLALVTAVMAVLVPLTEYAIVRGPYARRREG